MIDPVVTKGLRDALGFAALHLGGDAKKEHDLVEAREELWSMVYEFRADGISDERIADEFMAYTRKKIEERASG